MSEYIKALEKQRNELAGLLREAVALIAVDLPERECRCHLAPPCSNCVGHGYTYELLDGAKAALKGVEP